MLDPVSRSAIVTLSALCIAGMLALAPSRARSSSPVRLPFGVTLSTVDDAALPAEPVDRDPFDEPPLAPARIAARPAPDVAAESSSRGTGPLEALPSNLREDVIPALPGASPDPIAAATRVTAVVTGPHPYALVDTNGVHEIKGLGDRIGGSPIATIDIEGVALQNGVRLRVERVGP